MAMKNNTPANDFVDAGNPDTLEIPTLDATLPSIHEASSNNLPETIIIQVSNASGIPQNVTPDEGSLRVSPSMMEGIQAIVASNAGGFPPLSDYSSDSEASITSLYDNNDTKRFINSCKIKGDGSTPASMASSEFGDSLYEIEANESQSTCSFDSERCKASQVDSYSNGSILPALQDERVAVKKADTVEELPTKSTCSSEKGQLRTMLDIGEVRTSKCRAQDGLWDDERIADRKAPMDRGLDRVRRSGASRKNVQGFLQSRIAHRPPTRSPTENVGVWKGTVLVLESGPKPFSMDGFASSADESSIASGKDFNSDTESTDSEFGLSKRKPTDTGAENVEHVEGRDSAQKAKNPGDELKVGCAQLHQTSVRAMQKLRYLLPWEKSGSEQGEEEGDTEGIESDEEGHTGRRGKAVTPEDDNDGTRTAQVKKGEALKASFCRALTAIGRSLSCRKSPGQSAESEADASKVLSEDGKSSSLDMLDEDPDTGVDLDGEGSDLSRPRDVGSLATCGVEAEATEAVIDEIEVNDGPTATSHDDSKSTAWDASKSSQKRPTSMSAGMPRKLRRKAKRSANVGGKTPGEARVAEEGVPNTAGRTRLPFFRRLLSRSNSRVVADDYM